MDQEIRYSQSLKEKYHDQKTHGKNYNCHHSTISYENLYIKKKEQSRNKKERSLIEENQNRANQRSHSEINLFSIL